MIHAIGIVGFLFAAVCGCVAVKRTGNWAHIGHWFGWGSIIALACLAMPNAKTQPTEIPQSPKYVRTPHEQMIFERAEKRYFEKIKKENSDGRIAAKISS